MLGPILLISGIILMTFGLVGLGGWVSGRGERIGRPGGLGDGSKNERQLLSIYFVALVLTPLLAGAMLIAFGLGALL